MVAQLHVAFGVFRVFRVFHYRSLKRTQKQREREREKKRETKQKKELDHSKKLSDGLEVFSFRVFPRPGSREHNN